MTAILQRIINTYYTPYFYYAVNGLDPYIMVFKHKLKSLFCLYR